MGFTGKCYVFGILFLIVAFLLTVASFSVVLNFSMASTMIIGAGVFGGMGILLCLVGFLASLWKR
jgi:hypothetical protein